MKKNLLSLFFFTFSCLMGIAQTSVEFIVTDLPSNLSQSVGLRGNTPPLSWEKSIPMSPLQDTYRVTINFPKEVSNIEFKFVLFDERGEVRWEGTQNRTLDLKQKAKIISTHQWDVEQLVDIKALSKISPEDLLADYALIETMVLQVHPGTYRYNDSLSIRRALAELKQKFQQPLTHGEAYLAMSKVTAQLQCDHTKVGFNNQNKIINSVIHRQADKMPFTFQWMGEQMIVNYDATEAQQLKRGTEILSINGVKVADIQKAMFPYIAADGATDKNRLYKMGVDGYDFRYNAFDVFYPLLFPLTDNQLILEIQNYGAAAPRTLSVKPLTREARTKILSTRYPYFPKTRDDLWRFEITKDQIGILTLNSFGLGGWKRMTIDYKQFLADAFQQLKDQNIQHLIIDIRKNTGGFDEMKKELFTYLPLQQLKRSKIRTGKAERVMYNSLNNSNPTFKPGEINPGIMI